MKPLEVLITREICAVGGPFKEGFSLGRIYVDGILYGFTLEDEDRRLESGGVKVYGKTAIPLGRYRLDLYRSPKHGLVPLFLGLKDFSYVEIHGANHAEELLGCIAVGRTRTQDGVKDCAPVLRRLVEALQHAIAEGRDCYCTITRAVP